MPTFDTGTLFYTGLFPVDLRPTRRPDKSITSHSHLLREVLASLPNYSPEDRAALPSPFSRDSRTHFARFAIIDDPAFEGRVSGNTLLAAAEGVDPLVHQPVDHLSRSWLIFVADADAKDAGDSCRDLWARGLWEVMEPELRAIFRHCLGFRKVESGDDFAAYLAKGQVETTMSFHDYWIDPPNLPDLSMARIKGTILLPALLGALAVAWWRWWPWHWPSWPLDWGGLLLVLLGALIGLAIGIWLIIRTISSRGAKPWPAGADSDLPSVLKSLHVQREFARFAIDNQAAAPAELHAAFGRFIDEVKPADVAGPTQKAGVVP
ncbi:MAG TPA: hypothetical protein VF547_06185 [Allosphingosinicella sp.]|jgi:hypothetical protein